MTYLKSVLLLATFTTLLFSCSNENEDVTSTVDKSGSIETAVHISHIDSMHDELVTTHKVWVQNNVFKTMEYHDTIPALGRENREAENEEGNTKRISVPKDYEIYITVK